MLLLDHSNIRCCSLDRIRGQHTVGMCQVDTRCACSFQVDSNGQVGTSCQRVQGKSRRMDNNIQLNNCQQALLSLNGHSISLVNLEKEGF